MKNKIAHYVGTIWSDRLVTIFRNARIENHHKIVPFFAGHSYWYNWEEKVPVDVTLQCAASCMAFQEHQQFCRALTAARRKS